MRKGMILVVLLGCAHEAPPQQPAISLAPIPMPLQCAPCAQQPVYDTLLIKKYMSSCLGMSPAEYCACSLIKMHEANASARDVATYLRKQDAPRAIADAVRSCDNLTLP